MSRFDHITYDGESIAADAMLTTALQQVEATIGVINSGRATQNALARLEEAAMWARKGIRDSQIARENITRSAQERADRAAVRQAAIDKLQAVDKASTADEAPSAA